MIPHRDALIVIGLGLAISLGGGMVFSAAGIWIMVATCWLIGMIIGFLGGTLW